MAVATERAARQCASRLDEPMYTVSILAFAMKRVQVARYYVVEERWGRNIQSSVARRQAVYETKSPARRNCPVVMDPRKSLM